MKGLVLQTIRIILATSFAHELGKVIHQFLIQMEIKSSNQ